MPQGSAWLLSRQNCKARQSPFPLSWRPAWNICALFATLKRKGGLAMSGKSEYWISQEQLEEWVSIQRASDPTAKAILKGKTWNSSEIQKKVNQLRREISGTAAWSKRCCEVHRAYLAKLAKDEPDIAQSNMSKRSYILADMLERLWANPE